MSDPDFRYKTRNCLSRNRIGARSRDKITSTENIIPLEEHQTQTSKTILQLAALELSHKKSRQKANAVDQETQSQNPSPEKSTVRYVDCSLDPIQEIAQIQKEKKLSDSSERAKAPGLVKSGNIKSREGKEFKETKDGKVSRGSKEFTRVPKLSRFTIKEIRVKSVEMGSSCSVEACLSSKSVESSHSGKTVPPLENFPSSRRGRSLSPSTQRSLIESREKSSIVSVANSDSSKCRDLFHSVLTQMKNPDWDAALKGMVEFAEHSPLLNYNQIYAHMTEINQRLIDFLRSPRSYVCRTSCQVAGKLFEVVKDTRRPEFDEIVDILLAKTADSNKFIRKDANVALDSLILHISPFHTVRAISQKGPHHKNDLVRISCARLFVCIVGISGTNLILNTAGNEYTRKRILNLMVNFIKDKNFKVREFGIRLYLLMRDHPNFETYFNKLVDKCSITDLKKILKEKA